MEPIKSMDTYLKCPCVIWQIAKLYLKTKYTVSREFYKLSNDLYLFVALPLFCPILRKPIISQL